MNIIKIHQTPVIMWLYIHLCFFPRCMECQRGLAMKKVSLCLSVRLSCLSVKRVHCDKTEERSVQIFIPHERSFSLVSEKKNGSWRATPFTWNFGPPGIRWSEFADFEPIFTRSVSAVTPIEKSSINTNRKYTTRFPVSLRWSLYVALSPQKGLKNAKRALSV